MYMCVFEYVYIYICIYLFIYVCIYLFIYLFIYLNMCVILALEALVFERRTSNEAPWAPPLDEPAPLGPWGISEWCQVIEDF